MIIILTIACLIFAAFILTRLTLIDLKERLLPNTYVGAFLICGLFFHIITQWYSTSIIQSISGMFAGGGMLLMIRQISNKMHGADTLGLGDVKLIGAAGFWLGLSDIFLAISIGALAGLLHGIVYKFYLQHKTGNKVPLAGLSIPAGPGFIFGIIITAIIKFQSLPAYLGL